MAAGAAIIKPLPKDENRGSLRQLNLAETLLEAAEASGVTEEAWPLRWRYSLAPILNSITSAAPR
ncbi:hypothetical protein GCM10022409_17650 [Hymenobacter glaciei]|uniref:Uncharacterized protein n=1 Tax=Hymenobacter glaciei TaxID=877209 RepID=A0ABP7TZT9_9BACT